MQRYPYNLEFRPPVKGSFGQPSFAPLWNASENCDFISGAGNSAQFETLSNGKLNLSSSPDSINCLHQVHFSFTFQNQFYIIGRQSHVLKNRKEWKEIPILDCQWEYGEAYCVHNQYLYKFGHREKHGASRFCLNSLKEISLPDLSLNRLYCSSALHPESECIFVSGGVTTRASIQIVLDTIEVFDTKTQQFLTSPLMMPKPLWNHYSFCFNNFYFLVGGAVEIFTISEIRMVVTDTPLGTLFVLFQRLFVSYRRLHNIIRHQSGNLETRFKFRRFFPRRMDSRHFSFIQS